MDGLKFAIGSISRGCLGSCNGFLWVKGLRALNRFKPPVTFFPIPIKKRLHIFIGHNTTNRMENIKTNNPAISLDECMNLFGFKTKRALNDFLVRNKVERLGHGWYDRQTCMQFKQEIEYRKSIRFPSGKPWPKATDLTPEQKATHYTLNQIALKYGLGYQDIYAKLKFLKVPYLVGKLKAHYYDKEYIDANIKQIINTKIYLANKRRNVKKYG